MSQVPSFIEEKRRVKTKKTKGGGSKRILIASSQANVIVDGKTQKTTIKTVVENKADKDFVRRNIITKGAIIETELGKAVVTSRPGQHGTVNAKLLKK